MKIFCYYIIKKEIKISEFQGIKADTILDSGEYDYSLYAFTPDKEISKLFHEMRDMKLFYEKIIYIDRSDYEDFCDENIDYLLEFHSFNTKVIKYGSYHCDTKYVLCTKFESDLILYYSNEYISDIIIDDLMKVGRGEIIDINFNKKLKKVLNNYFYYDEFKNSWREITGDVVEYKVDQLALFIRLFNNTLTKK